MKYTISKGYEIDSYEFGNELCSNGVTARVEAEQYGKTSLCLKNWCKNYTQIRRHSQRCWVQVVSLMINGLDPTLSNKIQDPFFLDQIAQMYSKVSTTIKEFGAWVGDAGEAYNNGSKSVSHTFAHGFWYLDQLGMTSTFNHKVFCRQTLIGGNYGLLNTTTFIPNPDNYGALLWHRLMGKNVLATSYVGSPYLRAYSHCPKATFSI
ncbi:conserved hypothetical protein [Ricinus communis]|uniref:Heparanase n=1 Tax=Ricinus communis TaxID=3988 RepID=B9RCW7_RICCO|nr:conserved hypothetical protein [Ricinus communis]